MRLSEDIHSIAESLKSLAVTAKRIADELFEEPGSFTVIHGEPTKETLIMAKSKPASFGMKSKMKAGIVAGDKDTVTIGGFLNTDGTPYTGADPTIVPTSADPALTLDAPVGLTYGEH